MCLQYGGRRAVQPNPGQRRPGFHWERWGLMDSVSQDVREREWTVNNMGEENKSAILENIRNIIYPKCVPVWSLIYLFCVCDTGTASGLRMCPPVFLPEASEIMKDIGTAIEYLHHINIAHRDIKVHSHLIMWSAPGRWRTFDHICCHSSASNPARELAVHHQRKKRGPETDRLWLC